MDSMMMEIETKWEVLAERDYYRNYEFTPMIRCRIEDDRVWEWIRDDLRNHMDLTEEEERHMGLDQYVDRIVSFEVEVEYYGSKATGATCQTECPNFVKAWVEKEAMRKFNDERKEKVA
jgi:hypothetical protein